MRIALATCRNLPAWEVDDRPLHAALASRGVAVDQTVWDDPEVRWSEYDACLIRTTWDYQEDRDRFLAWARQAARVTRLFNPLAIVEWNTHKGYLRELAQRGVATLPTEWLSPASGADVAALVRRHGWRRGFLKPAVGATARETMRFEARGASLVAAQAHAHRLLARGEQLLLQPYCASVESRGEVSIVFIDGRRTHAVRKIPVAGDYRVQDDFGASDEPHRCTDDELELACRAMAAVDPAPLYGRCDLLRDDEGVARLTELELVEPSLFFRHCQSAAERLAEALLGRLSA